jgi:hypothetical protein
MSMILDKIIGTLLLLYIIGAFLFVLVPNWLLILLIILEMIVLPAMYPHLPSTSEGLLVMFPILLAGIFLPARVAVRRKVEPRWIIFGLNLFLWWTFVMWLVLLIWAYQSEDHRPPKKVRASKKQETVPVQPTQT